MATILCLGSTGDDVAALAKALADALGDHAADFPSLATNPSTIGTELEAAIRRWQAGIGIIADGVVGPRCQSILGISDTSVLAVRVGAVSQLFPATKPANIARYLPYVAAALAADGLTDVPMVLAALGTIRAETEGFVPISEFQSKFNTAPGGAPFALYDGRLGNEKPGDGFRYRGRGFVQLTGKSNYATYGKVVGVDLIANPDLGNAPEVAAALLSAFLADHAKDMRKALAAGQFATARKLVNGGSHGLPNFKDVFDRANGVQLFDTAAAPVAGAAGATRGGRSARATKVPKGKAPASPHADRNATPRNVRTKRDAPDLRDRMYVPPPVSLEAEYPSDANVAKFLPAYTSAGLILDQGQEGACTGFGLACVINYMRWRRANSINVPGAASTAPVAKMVPVSPRMLYILARRYDEYDGENYEGSSCRGAIKGWYNNGVCSTDDWPYDTGPSGTPKYGFADRARETTLGVYYRIDTKSITDMQAAIQQHGAIFVSAFTHDGWNLPSGGKLTGHADLHEIAFDGRPSQERGHAFALVGFNTHGFVVQNSWGGDWGNGGFAILRYLDWLANGMDAWVCALGVPGVVAGQLASSSTSASGTAGADRSMWWSASLAYQHSVVFGTDGRVARYLTEDEQPRKLQQQACVLPDTWFRRPGASKTKRVVLYAHGGLNSEDAAIKRASAMGRFFIGNDCYPIFLVWRTGLMESIGGIISGQFANEPKLAGASISEVSDFVVEKTIGRPLAQPVWSQMKQQAGLTFEPRRGGDVLLDALQGLSRTWGDDFELHVVGHSAGSILLGYLLSSIAARNKEGRDDDLFKRMKSIHLFAPACTVSFANQHYAAVPEWMDRLSLSILTDQAEQDDNVARIYRKSLLYLVSNCLESDLRLPLLGLDRIGQVSDVGWDGTSDTTMALLDWRTAAQKTGLSTKRTTRVADPITVALDAQGKPITEAPSHGGFDNDVDVMTRTLEDITGAALKVQIDDLRGY